MKFRKKPVVIEAFRWMERRPGSISDCSYKAMPVYPEWWIRAGAEGRMFVEDGLLKIKTLEGVMTAQRGDWIILGVAGELYPCKPDIFATTYEPAGDTPSEQIRNEQGEK